MSGDCGGMFCIAEGERLRAPSTSTKDIPLTSVDLCGTGRPPTGFSLFHLSGDLEGPSDCKFAPISLRDSFSMFFQWFGVCPATLRRKEKFLSPPSNAFLEDFGGAM